MPASAADSDGDGIPNKFESAGWWDTPNNFSGTIQRWTDKNFPTACNDDTTGPAFQAVLVYPDGETPDVQTVEEKKEFRRFISRVNSVFAASAEYVINTPSDLKTKSHTPRWSTFVDQSGKCAPVLGKQQIPADKFPDSSASWGNSDFWNYMEGTHGKNDPDRKYIYFLQNPTDTQWGGVAESTAWCGTDKSFTNCSNQMTHMHVSRPAIFGSGYWGNEDDAKNRVQVTAHEIGHSIGMVADESPDHNSQNSHHSKDCWAVMCYDASPAYPQAGQVYTGGCGTEADAGENKHYYRFDCNEDGTFDAHDPQTGYLSTHWNPADNRFLWGGIQSAGTGSRSHTFTVPTKRNPVVID